MSYNRNLGQEQSFVMPDKDQYGFMCLRCRRQELEFAVIGTEVTVRCPYCGNAIVIALLTEEPSSGN